MSNVRRSDYDVTNTVRVSSAPDVRDAVQELFESHLARRDLPPHRARLPRFRARVHRPHAGLLRRRHRLSRPAAHARRHARDGAAAWPATSVTMPARREALGAERAAVGVLPRAVPRHRLPARARRSRAATAPNSRATMYRAARASWSTTCRPSASRTGRASPARSCTSPATRRPFEHIGEACTDPRDIQLGHLLGTADMIAQMADRCYLEKCRDRLYPEFVLGGVALPRRRQRRPGVKYASGLDLLRQTPEFMEDTRQQAPRRRLQPGLPLRRAAVRRHQSLHRFHRPQPAISCGRSCAARAGACFGAARRCSPPSPIRSPACAG